MGTTRHPYWLDDRTMLFKTHRENYTKCKIHVIKVENKIIYLVADKVREEIDEKVKKAGHFLLKLMYQRMQNEKKRDQLFFGYF